MFKFSYFFEAKNKRSDFNLLPTKAEACPS